MTRFYLLCGQLKDNIVRMCSIYLKLVYKKLFNEIVTRRTHINIAD